jgi:hypothetical protein
MKKKAMTLEALFNKIKPLINSGLGDALVHWHTEVHLGNPNVTWGDVEDVQLVDSEKYVRLVIDLNHP